MKNIGLVKMSNMLAAILEGFLVSNTWTSLSVEKGLVLVYMSEIPGFNTIHQVERFTLLMINVIYPRC